MTPNGTNETLKSINKKTAAPRKMPVKQQNTEVKDKILKDKMGTNRYKSTC